MRLKVKQNVQTSTGEQHMPCYLSLKNGLFLLIKQDILCLLLRKYPRMTCF